MRITAIAARLLVPKPDISRVDAFKHALLTAKSIACSDSASGVYLSTTLFRQIGVYDQIKDKARKIPAEPVAKVVARSAKQPEAAAALIAFLTSPAARLALVQSGMQFADEKK